MKNILIVLVLLVSAYSCSKNDDPTPELKTELLPDEIPVDTAGNLDFKKVPTTDKYLREDSTVSLYLHFMRTGYSGMGKLRTLSFDYLYVDSNGDTIFNPYHLNFTPNANQKSILTLDMGFKLKNYTVDFTGDSVYDGYRTMINSYRNYKVEKNILHVYQNNDENTTISYKIICIQKDERYMKASVVVDGKSYIVKMNISRFSMIDDKTIEYVPEEIVIDGKIIKQSVPKLLGDGYTSVDHQNSTHRIKRLRKEKVIFKHNITSLDIKDLKTEKVRF